MLPKKIAKAKRKVEDIITLRNQAKKVKVLEVICPGSVVSPTGSININPELLPAGTTKDANAPVIITPDRRNVSKEQ